MLSAPAPVALSSNGICYNIICRMKKTILYLIIFALGFSLVSFWSFWSVVRPPKIASVLTPEQFNLPAEEISIIAHDDTRLAGWLVEPPAAGAGEARRPVLVFLHGYQAEKSDLLPIAAPLYPDFSLLLLDLRSFGNSAGVYTTLGLREKDDVRSAIDFIVSRGYERIGLFGFSLGGAVALLAAAEETRIRALAAYASFADLRVLGDEIYRRLGPLKYPLVELMIVWSRLFFGDSLARWSPELAAPQITVPVLLAHARADEQISFNHAKRLQAAMAGNPRAEFFFFEPGRHGDWPDDFPERLRAFFAKHL